MCISYNIIQHLLQIIGPQYATKILQSLKVCELNDWISAAFYCHVNLILIAKILIIHK